MTWVAWRQYRLELILAAALLVALAAFLVPTGLDISHQFETSGLEACLNTNESMHARWGWKRADATACEGLVEAFMMNGYGRFAPVLEGLTFLPAILGILLASPALLELEQRTYRLAWTQSITRRRWIAIKLGLALFGALALSGVVVLLMNWWLGPLDRVTDPFWGQLFNLRGITPAAYTVFCLALALAVGALLRRMVPAILVTLVAFFVALLWVGDGLRPYYLAPIEQITAVTGDLPGKMPGPPTNSWIVDVDMLCTPEGKTKKVPEGQIASCLESQRVVRTLYQPADRFWTFQAIEAAIFLAAAAAFFGLTVWAVTTRSRWRLA